MTIHPQNVELQIDKFVSSDAKRLMLLLS